MKCVLLYAEKKYIQLFTAYVYLAAVDRFNIAGEVIRSFIWLPLYCRFVCRARTTKIER